MASHFVNVMHLWVNRLHIIKHKMNIIMNLNICRSLDMILWCSHNANHPENKLAKFSYTWNMKVSFLKNIFLYSRLPIGTYHKNLAIWNFIFYFLKSSTFWPLFSWKILCLSQKLAKLCELKITIIRHRRGKVNL